MTTNEKLSTLRAAMQSADIAAYIIPSSDPHQSEYFADHWKTREWLSGFTGSAGYLVITAHHAGLWTDSRYYAQAEIEFAGTEWQLHKQVVQGSPEHIGWITKNLHEGSKVGFDGWLFSCDAVRNMRKVFHPYNLHLLTNVDFAAAIWKHRPALPHNPVFEHPVWYAGHSRTEKLEQIRNKMLELGAEWHLVTTLDDIAWTLNLRGSDVEFNPTFVAYLAIGLKKVYLFIQEKKVEDELKAVLHDEHIFLKPYSQISHFLEELEAHETILIDGANANHHLVHSVKHAKAVYDTTVSCHLKACKNEMEIRHIRNAMVKDGVALTRAFMWLHETLEHRTTTEYEVSAMIAQYRSQQADYMGESFNAIISYKQNGGIIHYHPQPESSAIIEKDGILLLDSGGQYIDGTTDITRTIALGEPSAEQKKHFTLVLKGHIALAALKFPAGTRGIQMDILARMPLWEQGLNFGHGTGHGVGYFMNVHEPPQGFTATLTQRGKTIMELGMLTSNEPGFYKDGEYGIRTENLMVAVNDEKTEFGQFLRFDTVTLFPIDPKMIDGTLLETKEKQWLNAYHQKVYRELAPHLTESERNWVGMQCREI